MQKKNGSDAVHYFYLRERFVPQVKEKTSTRSMQYASDQGLADFDLSPQPRVRMASASVMTNHGLAMSPAISDSPLVWIISPGSDFQSQQKACKYALGWCNKISSPKEAIVNKCQCARNKNV